MANAEGNALMGTIQHGDYVDVKHDWEYFSGEIL